MQETKGKDLGTKRIAQSPAISRVGGSQSKDADILGVISIHDLAQLLFKYGLKGIGRRSLMECMRRDGFLIPMGLDRNTPTPAALEMGLLEVHEAKVYNPFGRTQTIKVPMVTGAGQVYFIDRYLQEGGVA